MKNKYNTLHKYIYEYSVKDYRKETINGLFRSILQPLISNQKIESCILMRLNDFDDKKAIIKRLNFSGANILYYGDNSQELNYANQEIQKIWSNTEFLIVLSQRYSAALIWDYTLSELCSYSPVCMLYNSKIITDISKKVLENSKYDYKDLLVKYAPDRRENIVLNQAIGMIADLLNEKNEDIIFAEKEKENLVPADDTIKTAEIVSNNARFISHEIKNNLSIINLYSKILEKRIENIKESEEIMQSLNNAIRNITTASENVSSLISDLRCIASPYKTEISVKKIILNTIAMCQEKANNAGVNITMDDFEDFITTTDKTKLQCALINLIYNAIEACKESCLVNISCHLQEDIIKISVKNNGEMILPENQSKIFEKDYTTKEKGNGLGLAICKEQMKLVGGDINLVSSDEKMTEFQILIKQNN